MYAKHDGRARSEGLVGDGRKAQAIHPPTPTTCQHIILVRWEGSVPRRGILAHHGLDRRVGSSTQVLHSNLREEVARLHLKDSVHLRKVTRHTMATRQNGKKIHKSILGATWSRKMSKKKTPENDAC